MWLLGAIQCGMEALRMGREESQSQWASSRKKKKSYTTGWMKLSYTRQKTTYIVPKKMWSAFVYVHWRWMWYRHGYCTFFYVCVFARIYFHSCFCFPIHTWHFWSVNGWESILCTNLWVLLVLLLIWISLFQGLLQKSGGCHVTYKWLTSMPAKWISPPTWDWKIIC